MDLSVFSLRLISYDGASYRAELALKERYPVITIVLYFGNTLPYFNDYRINLFEIAFMSDDEISRFHSDFRIIAVTRGRIR